MRPSVVGAMPFPRRKPVAFDGVPTCRRCKRQPAERHHVQGYWRQCTGCLARQRAANARQKLRRHSRRCLVCGVSCADAVRSWCSLRCQRAWGWTVRERQKAAVIAALGGMCGCAGSACWHTGRCGVAASDVLTVDHTKRDGGFVRRVKRDGSLQPRRSGGNGWSRYKRALSNPEHGMELRCMNCHFAAEFAFRRSRRDHEGA